MPTATDWKPTGKVVIGHDGKPYLMHRGQTWARHADGGWYSVALTQPFITDCKICTPEETALYGVIYGDT